MLLLTDSMRQSFEHFAEQIALTRGHLVDRALRLIAQFLRIVTVGGRPGDKEIDVGLNPDLPFLTLPAKLFEHDALSRRLRGRRRPQEKQASTG